MTHGNYYLGFKVLCCWWGLERKRKIHDTEGLYGNLRFVDDLPAVSGNGKETWLLFGKGTWKLLALLPLIL